MRQRVFSAVLLVSAAVAGCDVAGNGDVTAGQHGANTINGSIDVPAGEQTGAVGTVNGSVHIDDNATVHSASTVNGGITMGAHASADSLSTVNGAVTLGPGARVAHSVTTVNGGMTLRTGADVGGPLRNVNGHIVLSGAHVGGGLRTVSGDIDVNGGSHVEGGLVVEKSSGWFNWNVHKPRVVIGPGAVVDGELRFDREVRLYVSDKATTGQITGASPVRFTGDHPPG
jgi:DUF4097 and DUF4098 domain-containing protein YvlB